MVTVCTTEDLSNGASPPVKPYFVGHHVATALFVGTLVVWTAMQGRQALQRRTEATVMDRGSRFVIVLCWIVGLILAALCMVNG